MSQSIIPSVACELSKGQIIGRAIQAEMNGILVSEQSLEHSYARLGVLLMQMRSGEHWRELSDAAGNPYTAFDFFMRDLSARYRKTTSQLFQYESIATTLTPYISIENLQSMGITKALELKRAHKSTNARVPDSVIAEALKENTTTRDLRAKLFAVLNMGTDNSEKLHHFDFGHAMFTKDERAEFVNFIKVATLILDLPPAMPDWMKRKAIFLAAAQEFFSTHAAEVYGPKPEAVDVD